jgi:VIT1/CCC1 family predicted Fe2+/Mn2+ transporter
MAMFKPSSDEKLSWEEKKLRLQYEHAQDIVSAWENDPCYPSNEHEKAVREFEKAASALNNYHKNLTTRYLISGILFLVVSAALTLAAFLGTYTNRYFILLPALFFLLLGILNFIKSKKQSNA